MAIFKRGKVYWFHFWFNGDHVQESTHQGNPRVARQMEAAHRTALAKGEVGIAERKPAPTLKGFAQRFIDEIQAECGETPATVEFYATKLKNLLMFEPLQSARLDQIDEELIAAYVQHRGKQVSAVTVNRELATLRRLLRMAHEWQVIARVPKIRLNLKAERNREYVMDHATERNYLEFAPQPLHDAALLMLDTGVRVGELLNLQWSQVHLQPVGDAQFGFIHIRKGKSKNAPRNLSLSPRLKAMLEARQAESKSARVFADETGLAPISRFTLRDQHSKMRDMLKLPKDAVIHSFRHTFGTRLGETGADAFTIMKVMGHCSVTVSQKYVHPTPKAQEGAFARLHRANEKAMASLPGQAVRPSLTAGEDRTESEKRQAPATVSATVEDELLTSVVKPV